ncbi:hypothetical protein [Streptomyces shenzhenensis]|uniref:hypothetical protein n=1 Tax=Streptomyces shenzhenensis TaxID=943815 RepID=UPI0015F01B3D|nr:hypothetical protein [Streptomyces shenzhenensis]
MESLSAQADGTYELEKGNCIHFHMVDFVAWNNRKFDMQAYYHAPAVYVEMGGVATADVDEHIDAMKDILVDNPEARILQHYPQVAQGEWTAVVGHYVPGDFRLCTFARHHEGQIVEEYLFMRELAKEEPDPYEDEKPFVTITSPDSELLQVAADVRPGWSAVIRGDELGKRSATFTRREVGEVVEELRFAAI